MSSESFASNWPGAWASQRHCGKGHHHHHHHHRGPGPLGAGGFGLGEGATGLLPGIGSWLFSRSDRPGGPTPEELEQLIEWRRSHGGGPFGGPGPFGRGGPRGRGRGRGRARRGDVRLALLRLLAEEPRNGYGLMQTIEERSDGRWSPSPGSVYPTLAQLEDEGLIRAVEAEGAKRLEITEAGREHLETRAAEPDPWAAPDGHGEEAIFEIGPLVIGIGKAAWQVASVAGPEQRARAVQLLEQTRRGLYRILAEEPDAGGESEGTSV
jgi:DNA-binding PadR family transcriptional regulator